MKLVITRDDINPKLGTYVHVWKLGSSVKGDIIKLFFNKPSL